MAHHVIGKADFFTVVDYLKPLDVHRHIPQLGCLLGLDVFSVSNMRNLPDEMVTAWIRGDNKVTEVTWEVLVEKLRVMGQNGVAERIFKEQCSGPTASAHNHTTPEKTMENPGASAEEPLASTFQKVKTINVPNDENMKLSLYSKVKLILQTCNPNEYKAVLERMTPLESKEGVYKFKDVTINFRIGKFANYTIALVYTDQCKGAKNPLLVALKSFPNAEAIIGIGVGFGVNPKAIKLGDVMVSKYITDASTLEIKSGRVKPRDGEGDCRVDPQILLYFDDTDIKDEWEFKVSGDRSSSVVAGRLVSSSNLIKDESFKQLLLDPIYKPIGGEMEGSLLLEIFHDYEVKKRKLKPSVIVIKGVADYGNEDKTKVWQPISAKAAVDYVHYCLEQTDEGSKFDAM